MISYVGITEGTLDALLERLVTEWIEDDHQPDAQKGVIVREQTAAWKHM